MKGHAVAGTSLERRSGSRKNMDQYCRVEFLSDGLGGTHRLKIWNRSTNSMCLLIEENSEILPRLKVGNRLKMIYCPTHSVYPCVYLGAVIRHITKKDQGPSTGHYLVGLETQRREDRRKT